MYPHYQCRTNLHLMIKLSTIFAQWTRWFSTFMGIVSYSSTIVTYQLSPTSSRSSFTSTSCAPLKTCLHHPRTLVRRPHFCLKYIGEFSIHHQFITSTVVLIMPYRPAEVAKTVVAVFVQTSVANDSYQSYVSPLPNI